MAADLAARATTTVMGCAASVVLVGAGDPAAGISRLHELEQRWSRFLDTSDVSKLNQAGGAATIVHPDTVTLVVAMVQGWHLTEGSYDPTLLSALVELGYDASRTDPAKRTTLPSDSARRGHPDAIRIDADADVVQLPAGTVIDPGGVGKGLAADLVVRELLDAGAQGALVEIGGDLRVAGRAPHPDGWVVALDDHGSTAVPNLVLADGAVATSTVARRRWTGTDGEHHHLLDPNDGVSSHSGVRTATVIASTGAGAEVMTKVAFVRSPADTLAFWHDRRLPGRLLLDDGTVHTTATWADFVHPTPAPADTDGARS